MGHPQVSALVSTAHTEEVALSSQQFSSPPVSHENTGVSDTHLLKEKRRLWGFELRSAGLPQALYPASRLLTSLEEFFYQRSSNFLLASFSLCGGNDPIWLPEVLSVNVLTPDISNTSFHRRKQHTVTACQRVSISGRWQAPL